jgi:hypothetical protein
LREFALGEAQTRAFNSLGDAVVQLEETLEEALESVVLGA